MFRLFASALVGRFVLALYGVVLLAVWFIAGQPVSLLRVFSILSTTSLLYYGAVSIIFGLTWYNAPWRYAWRRWPLLRRNVYPDLNGLWVGKMKSNWPVIQKLREAASSESELDLTALDAVPLQDVDAVMQIKAGLFGIRITAQFGLSPPNQNHNTSSTLFVLPSKDTGKDMLCLSYIYEQSTPNPASTDEGVHYGAARVAYSMHDEKERLSGDYWTKRRWREGMNTAGNISLGRISDRHAHANEDLWSAVNRLTSD